ncbi:MAG: outer membrane protein assembly factor [Bacteroidales bacterium]|nr:outer membrane protein assembly factor [Bacteroidales bacterium]
MIVKKMLSAGLSLCLILACVSNAQSQNENSQQRRFGFGPLPIVAFDADRGLQYGGLLNIFDYGIGGASFPNPRQQWYFEYSRFTRGTQQFFLTYDTRTLIPNVRMSLAATLWLDPAMDFYGFNGYQAFFDADNMSAFYRLDRRMMSFKADFVGNLPWNNWFWQASYYFSSLRYRPLDRNWFNEGRPENEQFHGTTLFEHYMNWGIIPENEREGGFTSGPRLGLMYDSRDFEAAPSRGIWAEANILLAPRFLGTTHPYNRYMFIFRHYIPIRNEQLVFAYRLNYQGTIGNHIPFYIMPVFSTIGREWDRDGLGGFRTIRGIMRTRVQGLDMGFFNAELRWRFVNFQVQRQNVQLALNAFLDGGMVTRNFDNSFRLNPNWTTQELERNLETFNRYVDPSRRNSLHSAVGGGFRIIINQNFIIAIDAARPFNNQNGTGGFYVNTGYLF